MGLRYVNQDWEDADLDQDSDMDAGEEETKEAVRYREITASLRARMKKDPQYAVAMSQVVTEHFDQK